MGSVHVQEIESNAPFNMMRMVEQIEDEVSTPFVTIPTRTYAKLCAAIEFLGGTALDVVGDAPIAPCFSLESGPAEQPMERTAAKAMQLITWGDNGLKAIDKQCYDLVLRMTKTQPGQDCDYVRVSLGAIAKRLGVSTPPASKALWGLADLGLLDAVTKVDPATGHKVIYARAGKMPAWGEVYAENVRREKDAARKRICESCESPRLKLVKYFVCEDCGTIQAEAPHYEELVDVLADMENSSPKRTPTDESSHMLTSTTSTISITSTTSTCSTPSSLIENAYSEPAEIEIEGRGTPTPESVVGPGPFCTPPPTKIYHIGPRLLPGQGSTVCKRGGEHVWVKSTANPRAVYCSRCAQNAPPGTVGAEQELSPAPRGYAQSYPQAGARPVFGG